MATDINIEEERVWGGRRGEKREGKTKECRNQSRLWIAAGTHSLLQNLLRKLADIPRLVRFSAHFPHFRDYFPAHHWILVPLSVVSFAFMFSNPFHMTSTSQRLGFFPPCSFQLSFIHSFIHLFVPISVHVTRVGSHSIHRQNRALECRGHEVLLQSVHTHLGTRFVSFFSSFDMWFGSTFFFFFFRFFTSLLSGRISSLKDEETGAIFIDRDPDAFRVILNWLRTKQVDLRLVNFYPTLFTIASS